MRQQMKVSVAILNWNRKDNTLDCLKHVYDLTYPLYQVIVVDNASTDGSVEAVREEYPEAIVVAKERNYGCSEGKNIGIRKALEANPDAIYYMDNDIVVDKDSLAELVKVLEQNPEAGSVGPKMFDYSKPDTLLTAGGIIDFTQNVSRGRGDGEKDVGQYDHVEAVDYIWGGAILVRSEVFQKIGLFDPYYVVWFEDSDFCTRIRRAGYKVLFCPYAKVWHRPHDTKAQVSFHKKYIATLNAIHFMKKYATAANWAKFLFYAIGGVPVAFVRDMILYGNPMRAMGKMMGIIHGLLGRDQAVRKMIPVVDE